MESNIFNFFINRVRYEKKMGKFFWEKAPAKNLTHYVGREVGTAKGNRYRVVRIKGKAYSLHRIVWRVETGAWPNYYIDHINGNPFDNRFKNLRDVTSSVNLQNSYKHRAGHLVGTSYSKSPWNKRRPWLSVCRRNGKNIYLGSYKTRKEAHNAYLKYIKGEK